MGNWYNGNEGKTGAMRIQRSLKHKKNKRIYISFLILFGLLFLVHDPLERTDVLRECVSGEGIVMDSSQLAFLVNRFCTRFLICIP